jgi:hypothetical protein
VFYDKGKSSEGWRYLEVAPVDVSLTVNGASEIRFTHNPDTATGQKIGDGKKNTQIIVENLENAGMYSPAYAAPACDEWSYGGYDDWFLPSAGELGLIYKNVAAKSLSNFHNEDLGTIGANYPSANHPAWYGSSSVLAPGYESWSYNTNMSNGSVHGWCGNRYPVRAVRAFDE